VTKLKRNGRSILSFEPLRRNVNSYWDLTLSYVSPPIVMNITLFGGKCSSVPCPALYHSFNVTKLDKSTQKICLLEKCLSHLLVGDKNYGNRGWQIMLWDTWCYLHGIPKIC